VPTTAEADGTKYTEVHQILDEVLPERGLLVHEHDVDSKTGSTTDIVLNSLTPS
jgi:hypothetical protein